MDPIEAFRESMYAATMVGSPLENAARVIHRHEPESRRYCICSAKSLWRVAGKLPALTVSPAMSPSSDVETS